VLLTAKAIVRFPPPLLADQAVLFLWRVASVGANVSMRCDRRQYHKALEVRAGSGVGMRAHAVDDGWWSFAAPGQVAPHSRGLADLEISQL
jgi:hypothetical protein